jgi:MinD-like ATPase involved in chromosome partitioning or flagellar assembly
MELIAFASGKGGTGKTLMASCLGYSLIRAGHRVLMIDADPATDGLSLFLLGPQGTDEIAEFAEENTFTGALHQFQATKEMSVVPRRINRAGSDRAGDHGVTYQAIISGRGLYGDDLVKSPTIPQLDQPTFREAVNKLFSNIRAADQFDYVIIDTRGGFSFESTDVCALADSFILVTDADITSFYQNRNLVKRISSASLEIPSKTLLRSIIVNRATEGFNTPGPINLDQVEYSFRVQLEREFPVKVKDTHPVPADIEVLLAYKTQRMPYLAAPASLFSFATLTAFGRILRIVTSKWSDKQVQQWNELVASVSEAVEKRNKALLAEREAQGAAAHQLASLEQENEKQKQRIEDLSREIDRIDKQYQRELARTEGLFASKSGKTEEMRRPSWAYRFRQLSMIGQFAVVVTLLAVITLGSFGAHNLYVKWQEQQLEAQIKTEQQRRQNLLKDLYNPSLPAAIRTSEFLDLIRSPSQYLGQQMSNQNFDGIILRNANLDDLRASRISLRGADLSGTSLRGSYLLQCDLSNAHLAFSDLSGANLSGSLLKGTDLSNSDLTEANLLDAELIGTNLNGANLTNAKIGPDQLLDAILNSRTILPDGRNGRPPK